MRLAHYFIPNLGNNFRAKILHHSHLLFVIAIFISLSLYTILFRQSAPSVLGITYSITASDLLSITNADRKQNHEPSLTLDSQLSSAAGAKAANMFKEDYWAHFAPDGTSPWYFIKGAGYNYVYAGENLAKGFTNSQDVVTAWMNSPSHRENMLSPNYSDIGYAVEEGKLQGEDTVLVVEMFGSKTNIAPQQENNSLPGNQQASGKESQVVQESAPIQGTVESSVVKQPLIDIRLTSKAITIIVLSTIIFVLLLDLYFVESRKIPRIVGHNLDHIILIILFVFFIILQSSGGIL